MLVPSRYLPLVECPGLDHRENKVTGKLLAQVPDKTLRGTSAESLLLEPVEFLLLANVRAVSDDLRAEAFLQPEQQNGSVETA